MYPDPARVPNRIRGRGARPLESVSALTLQANRQALSLPSMKSLSHPGRALLLAIILNLPALSQDVSYIELYRTGDYQQFTEGDPVPVPPDEWGGPFSLLTVMGMSGDFLSDPDNLLFVRAVTLQPPTGALLGLDFLEAVGGFALYDSFPSASALQSAYRAGPYRYTFGSLITGDEVFRMTISDASLPEPPRIINFAAAQNVDPSDAFTLSWTPASPEDGIAELTVFDAETGELVFESDTLSGAVTSATIPADTLRSGRTYEAEVTISRLDVLVEDAVPSLFATSSSLTLLPLKAGSGGGGALAIQAIVLESDGEVQLIVECQPGVPLAIQRSTALGGQWQTIQSETPAASPATLRVPLSSFGDLSFLRATQ